MPNGCDSIPQIESVAMHNCNFLVKPWSGKPRRVRLQSRQEQVQREIICKISRSSDYMMQHLDKPLQITQVSSIAGFSVSYFYFHFKRVTGHTPLEYFVRARMRRACELLEGTRLTVKEVAASLGYDDPFYFSRLFKSLNGVPPREYRRKTTKIVTRGRSKCPPVFSPINLIGSNPQDRLPVRS